LNVDKLKDLKGCRKVTVLTAYDYQMARILDNAGVDMILVGDSLGMVILGYEDTRQVTMEDMIRHTEAVARGVKKAHVIADMPIHSFLSVQEALKNARLLIEAGAHSVKIEGLHPEVIKALIDDGIPVMGHLGLLPQTTEVMKVKGKKKSEAEAIREDAQALDHLGVYGVVLECIPLNLAQEITYSIEALSIGIGAGVHCDGQVLVVNDMLGMEEGTVPKHAKVYANLYEIISEAVIRYLDEVKSGEFPDDRFSFR
jgi:3-methyl-2-oxobutanoate hydroxymethyltransferase